MLKPSVRASIGALLVLLFLSWVTVAAEQPYQPHTPRGQAAGQIVRKWAGYVQQVYGTSPARWAASMQGTFAEADLLNLQRATTMNTYEGMMGVLLGQQTSDTKVVDRMAAANSTTVAALAEASPAEDLVYTMVSPCRIVDTRNAGGRLTSGETRGIYVHGVSFTSQGGSTGNCAIPADPSAVVVNVVAVAPGSDGFLSVFPFGAERAASSLNYTRNSIVSNEIIAKTTVGQPVDLSVFSLADTDVVIDIVGYFAAPKTKMPDCRIVENYKNLDMYTHGFVSAMCPTGYAATGGACYWSSPSTLYQVTGQQILGVYEGSPYGKPAGYACNGYNNTGGLAGFYAQAVCCRLPGR